VLTSIPGIVRLEARPERARGGFELAALAGRLCSLGGRAALTLAFHVVLEAQRAGEPAAWVQRAAGFFPPDAAEGGVDLDALVVVRAPDTKAMVRAADQLARSGAFGLLVIDLGDGAEVPMPLLSRLLGLAQKHETAVLFLGSASLGSLISLRADSTRIAIDGEFECELRAVRDKRRAPDWTFKERFRGPAGLR
jgi:recombination protein RecA